MARNVFFSFHFDNDHWRAQQVRNIGAIDSQTIARPNEWEELRRKGDTAIARWIEEQMYGKSSVVVLVGSQTSDRPWIHYEIKRALELGKALLGVRIHELKDQSGNTSMYGGNPFDRHLYGSKILSSLAQLHWPSGSDSKQVYASIRDNLEDWIEAAVDARRYW